MLWMMQKHQSRSTLGLTTRWLHLPTAFLSSVSRDEWHAERKGNGQENGLHFLHDTEYGHADRLHSYPAHHFVCWRHWAGVEASGRRHDHLGTEWVKQLQQDFFKHILFSSKIMFNCRPKTRPNQKWQMNGFWSMESVAICCFECFKGVFIPADVWHLRSLENHDKWGSWQYLCIDPENKCCSHRGC